MWTRDAIANWYTTDLDSRVAGANRGFYATWNWNSEYGENGAWAMTIAPANGGATVAHFTNSINALSDYLNSQYVINAQTSSHSFVGTVNATRTMTLNIVPQW